LRRRQLALLESADREWRRWRDDLFRRQAAAESIEDLESIFEEWQRLWKMRHRLNQKLRLRRRQLALLKDAYQGWRRWRDDLYHPLAAGAGIEDQGRITG